MTTSSDINGSFILIPISDWHWIDATWTSYLFMCRFTRILLCCIIRLQR